MVIYIEAYFAQVAQSVEQRTENPRVGGSIPSLGTTRCKASQSTDCEAFFFSGGTHGAIQESLLAGRVFPAERRGLSLSNSYSIKKLTMEILALSWSGCG